MLDAAHNPHGAEALAAALEDSFAFSPLIGVIGVMADKDHEALLAALEPHAGPRRLHPELHRPGPAGRRPGRDRARVFGEDRVTVTPSLGDALEQAAALAEAGDAFGDPLGAGAVLVTGSVITVGEARTMLTRRPVSRCRADEPTIRARRRLARGAACALPSSPSRRSPSG